MNEVVKCPVCGTVNRPQDIYCCSCDADLGQQAQDRLRDAPDDGKTDAPDSISADGKTVLTEDEFSILDYRPKSKRGCLLPGLVVLVVLSILAVGIFVLNDGFDFAPEEEEAEAPELKIPLGKDEEDEEELEEEDPKPDEEEEEEIEEPEEDEVDQPDYDQLEAALLNWLIGRVNDPTVIMLHVDDAQDPEKFYERYDPVEENIIVYKEESKDDQFVTVIFGPPFSEWSIRAVFMWDQAEWRFLREEDVR